MQIRASAAASTLAAWVCCVLGTGVLLGPGCGHPSTRPPRQQSGGLPAPEMAQEAHATNDPLRIVVSFPETARSNPITGRVLLFLSRRAEGEPRQNGILSVDQPLYARDTTNWPPGTPLVFEPALFRHPDALAFPGPLYGLDPGTYRAQALIDLDETRRDFNRAPGNLYSSVVPCTLDGNRGGTISLIASNVVTETERKDTEWVKLVEVRSRLLSEFSGRERTLRAAVILPSTYTTQADARFPTLYVVPGFGERHTSAWGWINTPRGDKWKKGEVPLQMLRVVLDPDVPLGHSVFANSDNNGPVGDALVQELIPEIERQFRALPQARARFVTGHSSGGWASLWLQIAYPDFFGGCWSTAPDPVDFRAFQTMNIYQDRNGHWTPEGSLRPLSRHRDRVGLTFQQINHLEYVLGPGGQLESFNAVFGPRGNNGAPRPLMDKLSGAIDRTVAEHWKRYDIRLILEQNWPTLGPKLKGKLHVIAGGWDTFYLNPATERLRDFLATTDFGGYVEILPGDHGSFLTDAVVDRIAREIAGTFANGSITGANPGN